VVQPFRRVGEIPVGQARIQPPGEADDLLHGVAIQRGRGVHMVTRLDPAGFSELETFNREGYESVRSSPVLARKPAPAVTRASPQLKSYLDGERPVAR
jgi:hypothetical protein